MGTFDEALARSRCLDGMRILLVDDDEGVRDVLTAILCFYGADAHSVGSPEEARARLAASHFDVLLSDIEMPLENGYDFIRSVRGSRRVSGIAAAAVTSCFSTDECRDALDAGFDLVVGKPLDARTLVDAVRALVALTRLTARRAVRSSIAGH
jgi:two-component system CheB/CheR fusion protein